MKNTAICLITFWAYILCFTAHVDANEFDHKIDLEKIVFQWKITGDSIHVKLSAKTTGWVGIGFNPTKAMKDGNFILGYVKRGKVKVTDHFGITARQHMKDKKVGGETNLSDISGQEKDGITEVTFVIPLKSGDPKDQPISSDKENTILLAYGGDRDSFRTKHKFKAVLKVNLASGKFTKIR